MTVKDRIVELRRVKASELRPNPKNWRTHPKAQQEALRGILAEVGFADALIARQLEGGALELIDGHLRAETTPDMLVPVLVLDVTAAEADKLLASLDPLAAMAEADKGKLEALLRSLTTDSPALGDVFAQLAREAGIAADDTIVQDEAPAPLPTPVTRKGDLWVLGDHRLLCGDSSNAGDVDRLLGGVPVHLVNTDPPYNVKVEPRSNNAIAAGLSSFSGTHHQGMDVARHPSKGKGTTKVMRAKDRPLANDFVSEAQFEKLLLAWFGNMARVLVPGGGFYIWGGYANCANYPPAMKASALYFSQALIWVKEHPVLTRKDFMGNHEWCFYGWKEGAAHRFFGPANIPDTWSVKKVNPNAMVHLTEKPVELASRAMHYSSKAREHVLDLFGGSGSTLIAAEQTTRRAFLMELDMAYCDVIVQRWQNLTKRHAVLDGTTMKWEAVAAKRKVAIPAQARAPRPAHTSPPRSPPRSPPLSPPATGPTPVPRDASGDDEGEAAARMVGGDRDAQGAARGGSEPAPPRRRPVGRSPAAAREIVGASAGVAKGGKGGV